MGLLGLSNEDSLALATGLLGANNWQQGLSRGLLGLQASRANASEREKSALALEQMRKQIAEQEQMRQLAQQHMMPGTPGQAPLTPNDDEGNQMPGVAPQAPRFDMGGYANAMMGVDPMKGLQLKAQMAQAGQRENPYAKIDPKDYTPESVQRFAQSQNPGDLVPYRKPEGPQKGAIREVKTGGNTLTYEWDGGKWQKIASAPTHKPEAGEKPEKPPTGYRMAPDGNLTFIPGGPADPATGKKQAVPTEDERRSAGLAIRMESAVDAMKQFPGSRSPEKLPELLRAVTGGHLEAPANTITSSARQQVESAQLDALDAALTLATGAAYTKDQLKNLSKSYFPQLGDSDATKSAKEKKLEEIIQTARIRAGRAQGDIATVRGNSAPAAPAGGGWSITKVN